MRKTFNNFARTLLLSSVLFAGGGQNSLRAEAPQETKIAVTGVVSDAEGPIIGAGVREKGNPGNGVATDVDGRYTLQVSPTATLQVSYLGYATQEIPVEGKTSINVTLAEDANDLEEVVVVGYGVQKKKLVTGATVQVKGEDIAKLNTVSVLGALQSQAPGVSITQTSGFIGDGYKVNIRGLSSNSSSSPLYIIDGVPGGNLDALSPNDIESIDVLKDAASAAIYGARGANGIILVTTKQGRDGKVEITYDGNYGVQNLYKIPTILTAQEYMSIQDQVEVLNGHAPNNWAAYIPAADLAAIKDGSWKGTNWLKEIQNKNAPVQTHSLGINGGNDRSRYSLGLTYTNQQATMGVPTAVPELARYNIRINAEHILYKNSDFNILKVGESIKYRYQESNGSVARDDIYWNTVKNSLVASPLMRAYNADGSYYTYDDQQKDGYNWDTSSSANKNPIAYMDYLMNQNLSKSHSAQTSFYAELQPIKNLRIKSQYGYNLSASSYRAYTPAYEHLTASLYGAEDRVSQSLAVSSQWSWDNTVNYVFNINEQHHFDALLGQSVEKRGNGESISGSNQNSAFSDFKHAYLSNVPGLGSVQSLTGSPNDQWALASFFGRVNYNFNETYMASFILRADGSSIFAPGHRWGYFPSFSAGWVASNEDFLNSVDAVNFLKLRASYGQNGNLIYRLFQYQSPISSNNTYGGYPFGDSMGDAATGAYGYRLTNPNLKWETQKQLNIGIDARFLDNRLGVEFDWYNRTVADLLIVEPVLGSYGSDAAAVNGGDVENTGVELGLHWNDRVGKDFTYGANIAFGQNKNEVVKLGQSDATILGPTSVLWETSEEVYRIAEVGKPFGYFIGYAGDGIFQNQEQINNYKGALLRGKDTRPGDVIWRDANNDGAIDAKDRTMIGDPHPDFTLGFSFNVGYKGLELSATAYGAFGHQILKCYRDYIASPLNNYTTDVYTYWHGEGTANRYPRLGSADWTRVSDLLIEDGDYLKIKDLTLGYDFKRILKQLPLAQLKLFVTAQNLYTFTGYSGMDPEVGYGNESSVMSGIDLGFYPSARTYMVGASIKF